MNTELIQLINIIRYRLGKSVLNAKEGFYDFKLGNNSRSPSEILSHLVDVSNYGLKILEAKKPANGEHSTLEKIKGNFAAMESHLSQNKVSAEISKKLVNGPLSDTLTHIGQLAFLRRLQGNPLDWEDYTQAKT